jgi:Bacterial regulatory protein, Fis family
MESGRALEETTADVERQMIPVALSRADRVRPHAARLLGLTEQSPLYRVKKYVIQARVAATPLARSPPPPAPGSLRPAPVTPRTSLERQARTRSIALKI